METRNLSNGNVCPCNDPNLKMKRICVICNQLKEIELQYEEKMEKCPIHSPEQDIIVYYEKEKPICYDCELNGWVFHLGGNISQNLNKDQEKRELEKPEENKSKRIKIQNNENNDKYCKNCWEKLILNHDCLKQNSKTILISLLKTFHQNQKFDNKQMIWVLNEFISNEL